MKRSRINDIITESDEMMRSFGFVMPPFAYWSPEEFKARKDIAKNVIDARCGWDITDYGAGKYDEMGLFLFTLRNGRLADLQRGGGMCYAEKAADLQTGSTQPNAHSFTESGRHH